MVSSEDKGQNNHSKESESEESDASNKDNVIDIKNNSGADEDSNNGSKLSKSDEDAESDDDFINSNNSKDALPASTKKGVLAAHGNDKRP